MGKWSYGVILDAGSSGTRLHIYKWLKVDKARASASTAQLAALPIIESIEAKKIHPGVSTFGNTPELIGPNHLAYLFEHAFKHIPDNEIKNTPLFLFATAGMRLLPSYQRQSLLDHICTYTQLNTNFLLPDCSIQIQVISGETEGLYGWVATNYLLGGFDNPHQHDHGKEHHTYGFLDMGGASAQIAFAPNATETEKHANDLTFLRLRTINGAPLEYKVFVTTWLGFGANEARSRYIDSLAVASPDAKEIPDPCLHSGLTWDANATLTGNNTEQMTKTIHLVGTGDFTGCMGQTYPLLDKDAPCPDQPCSMHGVHLPAIDFQVNHFVGISEYWHTTHEVFEMSHKDGAYNFHDYQKKVLAFCSQDWGTIKTGIKTHKWGAKVTEQTAREVCFKASWLMNVLHDGIGVPREGFEHAGHNHSTALNDVKDRGYLDPFQSVNKINGVEVSWTLGKIVLYASSQIPSAVGALSVGFGSNAPGVPSDFQFAGFDNLSNFGNTSGDWRDTVVRDSPRRIPGFIIFVIILAIAILALCGRDRRKHMARKIFSAFGGGYSGGWKRHGFVSKFFRHSNGPMYERVLENGNSIEDFELGEVDSDNDHSDSHNGSPMGRASGWATPQLKVDLNPVPPSFDNPVTQGINLNLLPTHTINPMGRSGLMSRTDSRERLTIGTGHFSGTASPTRMRSPMIPPPKIAIE